MGYATFQLLREREAKRRVELEKKSVKEEVKTSNEKKVVEKTTVSEKKENTVKVEPKTSVQKSKKLRDE